MRRITAIVVAAFLIAAACGDDEGGGTTTGASPLAAGGSLYESVCASCHGSGGGGGVGPALDVVTSDFPDCADQVRWITLGSSGWEDQVGPSYGALEKPVRGGMPAYEDALTEQEIREVSAFIRARFAGQPEGDALTDCGA